jgi:hypothetical protein
MPRLTTLVLHGLVLACATSAPAPRPSSSDDRLLQLVEQIRQADYAGDRQALRDLHAQLAAAPAGSTPKFLVRYWQGFALWRRAINGFNETPTPGDLDSDLVAASAELEAAIQEEPTFVDAQAGLASCLGMRIFLRGRLDDETRALLPRVKALLQQAQSLEPDNPRLLWVRGPTEFWTPKGSSEDVLDAHQTRAVATYVRGLEALPSSRRSRAEPLRPSWGEPELHMSLAWSYLNRRVPDPAQAEIHARRALELVPTWHYVRDILLPQIQAARGSAAR